MSLLSNHYRIAFVLDFKNNLFIYYYYYDYYDYYYYGFSTIFISMFLYFIDLRVIDYLFVIIKGKKSEKKGEFTFFYLNWLIIINNFIV